MTDDYIDPMIDTPISCEDTTEYNNRIEDMSEIQPEDEQGGRDSHYPREETDQEFARYERNYRARRIRELTIGPARQGKKAKRPRIRSIAA